MFTHCPTCGKAVATGTKFCDACGYNLEFRPENNPVCPQCNTVYPPGTTYCIKDGAKLTQQQHVVRRCMICDTAYPADVKFCPADGGEVKAVGSIQYAQIPYSQQSFQNLRTNQRYLKASIGNRFLAALLDNLITGILSIPAIIFFVSGFATIRSGYGGSALGMIFVAILFYLIPLAYQFIKDGLGKGQSLGKKAMDLMVINLDNNTPCDIGKSILRNLISGLIILIPFIGWLIEPILVLATNDGRKLGDKAANTQVIDKNAYN